MGLYVDAKYAHVRKTHDYKLKLHFDLMDQNKTFWFNVYRKRKFRRITFKVTCRHKFILNVLPFL